MSADPSNSSLWIYLLQQQFALYLPGALVNEQFKVPITLRTCQSIPAQAQTVLQLQMGVQAQQERRTLGQHFVLA